MKDNTHIPQLTVQLHEIEQSIDNITAAIEKGIASETLMNRLVQLEREKKQISRKIKEEEKFIYRIDRDQIVFWLSQFKYGDIENEDFRRHLIDLLINSVTVWDEPDGYKITTAYNLTSCKTKTFRVEKNSAAEATGFGFEGPECTSSEIPCTAPFPASPKTALCRVFLHFQPRPAALGRGWGPPCGRRGSGLRPALFLSIFSRKAVISIGNGRFSSFLQAIQF